MNEPKLTRKLQRNRPGTMRRCKKCGEIYRRKHHSVCPACGAKP